jgi:hypothetical protein
MRVIFLDIDGVLNSETHLRRLDEQHRQLGHEDPTRPEHETTCECYRLECQIDRAAVARLNRLVAETGAKIVVSSSWRKLLDPPELHRVLANHGLIAEILGETPDGCKDPETIATFGYVTRIVRGYEIDLWLRQHPEVERFVILDDSSDMEMHMHRLVQTDCEEGLLDEHVDLAIHMMAAADSDHLQPEPDPVANVVLGRLKLDVQARRTAPPT